MGKDYQTETQSIDVAPWEGGDWVVTVNGRPVGQTISSNREAKNIAEWVRTALWEIRDAIDLVKARATAR